MKTTVLELPFNKVIGFIKKTTDTGVFLFALQNISEEPFGETTSRDCF